VNDERFLTRVAEHTGAPMKQVPDWVKDRSIPSWIQERYDVEDLEDRSTGAIVTSIVKETSGKFPGRPFLNAFEVPDVGKLFLGELIVDCQIFPAKHDSRRIRLPCARKYQWNQQRKPTAPPTRLAASLDPLGVGV